MERQEFITRLRRNLSGIDDIEYINDTVNYYENYIDSEIRKGETEETVLRMLGDPGLIAKSIRASRGELTSTRGTATESYEQSTEENGRRTGLGIGILERLLRLPSWALKLGGVAVVAIVLILFGLLLQWLFPVLVVGGIAYVFYKFVRDNFLN